MKSVFRFWRVYRRALRLLFPSAMFICQAVSKERVFDDTHPTHPARHVHDEVVEIMYTVVQGCKSRWKEQTNVDLCFGVHFTYLFDFFFEAIYEGSVRLPVLRATVDTVYTGVYDNIPVGSDILRIRYCIYVSYLYPLAWHPDPKLANTITKVDVCGVRVTKYNGAVDKVGRDVTQCKAVPNFC